MTARRQLLAIGEVYRLLQGLVGLQSYARLADRQKACQIFRTAINWLLKAKHKCNSYLLVVGGRKVGRLLGLALG